MSVLKKDKKNMQKGFYRSYGFQTSYLLMAEILKNEERMAQKNIENIGPFIYSGILPNPEIISEIDQKITEFLKN